MKLNSGGIYMCYHTFNIFPQAHYDMNDWQVRNGHRNPSGEDEIYTLQEGVKI